MTGSERAERTCAATGKLSYPSRSKATSAARAIAKRTHNNRKRTSFGRARSLKSTEEIAVRAFEIYQCRRCHHWHLGTSVRPRKPATGNRRLSDRRLKTEPETEKEP